jgi:hypothetical protein
MENINYQLQEKIQSYVNKGMDDAAKRELQAQAQSEPGAAEELAFSQSLVKALRHREMTAAAAVLSEVIRQEGFPPPAAPTTSFWSQWSSWIIGSVLILAIAGGGFFWADSQGMFLTADQKKAQLALTPLENVFFTNTPQDGPEIGRLRAGMQAYDAGKYADAARIMTDVPELNVQLYVGVSHLMNDNPDKAIGPLTEVLQSPEPPVREAASWYLALAYHLDNQPDEAKRILRKIPQEGLYGEQAKKLLQD